MRNCILDGEMVAWDTETRRILDKGALDQDIKSFSTMARLGTEGTVRAEGHNGRPWFSEQGASVGHTDIGHSYFVTPMHP